MSTKNGKIYKITNNENGLIYIGCTIKTLNQRFIEHLYRCFKTDYNSKLYNSIRKYGKEKFIIELIEECDLSVIYETEKKYIDEYDTYNNGLNTTLGGEGCLGYTHSPEIKKKISENTKNGNSHKNKTYKELYGDKAEDEKEKRRLSVKKGWELMSKTEKEKRLKNARETLQKKSEHGVELIREIKQKLREGTKVKELKKLYPQIGINYFYTIKNGNRWSNIN